MSVERLRATLLAGAEAEADALRDDAGRQAAEESDRSQEESQRLLARAHAEGAASGELQAGRALALARAEFRRVVLEAKAGAYRELGERALAAAFALRDDGEAYGRLLEELESEARRALGRGAQVDLDPPGVGGVRATAGRRSVDLTLPVLVERCTGSLGPSVEELWR